MVCKLGPQSLREHPSEEQSHRLTRELFLTDPRVTQIFRVRHAWLFISSERLPSSIVEEAATTPKAADLLRPRFRSWRQAAVCPQRVEKQTPLGSKNHFSSPKADMIVSQVFLFLMSVVPPGACSSSEMSRSIAEEAVAAPGPVDLSAACVHRLTSLTVCTTIRSTLNELRVLLGEMKGGSSLAGATLDGSDRSSSRS